MLKTSTTLLWLLLIAAIFFTACNNANTTENVISSDTLKKENPTKPVFTITAEELCSDFTTNKENALNKYQHNEVMLSGLVQLIKAPTTNNEPCSYIMLACTNNDGSGTTIKCCLQQNNPPEHIQAGDKVTLKTTVVAIEGNVIRCEDAVIQ